MGTARLSDLAASGFGSPLARYGFLLVWAMHLINGLITGFLSLDNPAAVLAYAMALAAVLLVTSPGAQGLSSLSGWTVVLTALLAGTLSLFFDDGWAPVGLPYLSAFLLGMLVTRGKPMIGAFGLAGLLAALLVWGLGTRAPHADLIARLIVTVCMTGLGYLWVFLIDRVTARELAGRAELAAADAAARIAAESARRTAEDLRWVRDEARPMLEAMRDRGRIGAERHQALVIAEASIRDRIRVPRLQSPELYRAIRQARERSVSVSLIGEATDTRPVIGVALARSVAEALGAVRDGEVTLRIPPEQASPGHDGVALTVHLRTSSATIRLSFDAEGEVLERR